MPIDYTNVRFVV